MSRHTVAWFLAAHVAAASALLGIAASVGGGWSGPVMPPLQLASAAPMPGPSPGPYRTPEATGEPFTTLTPRSTDLPPPWQIEADGRVQWRSD